MQLTPIGNANFINQNAPVASAINANQNARFELQAAMATKTYNEEREKVNEVRPTEEIYKIDPEQEHERKKRDQENARAQKDDEENIDDSEQISASFDEQSQAQVSDLSEIVITPEGEELEVYHLDIKI